MPRYYHSCLLIAGLVIAARALFLYFDTPRLPCSMTVAAHDPESTLAAGLRIPLASADTAALLLIPGISDLLAGEILEKRQAILAAALLMPADERYRALEMVHGIGPRRAMKFGEYLELATSGVRLRRN